MRKLADLSRIAAMPVAEMVLPRGGSCDPARWPCQSNESNEDADDLLDLVTAGCTETEILQVMGEHPIAPVKDWRARGQRWRTVLGQG